MKVQVTQPPASIPRPTRRQSVEGYARCSVVEPDHTHRDPFAEVLGTRRGAAPGDPLRAASEQLPAFVAELAAKLRGQPFYFDSAGRDAIAVTADCGSGSDPSRRFAWHSLYFVDNRRWQTLQGYYDLVRATAQRSAVEYLAARKGL